MDNKSKKRKVVVITKPMSEISDYPYYNPINAPCVGIADEQELENHSLSEQDVEQLRAWDIENRL